MECSLSTWPSITQFDDWTWMGLGDIDPLESLDRSLDNACQLARSSSADLDEMDVPSIEVLTIPDSNPAKLSSTKSDDFYRLTSAESLAAARWESINAADLALVLDSFPRSNEASSPSEDVTYDLYSDSIIMQQQTALSGEVDAFVSASMSEIADGESPVLVSADKNVVHVDAKDMASNGPSLPGSQEDMRCESSAVDDESLGSVNVSTSLRGSLSHMGMESSAQTQVGCSGQIMEHVAGGYDAVRADAFEPSQCLAIHPINLQGRRNTLITNHGALDVKESMSPPHHDCIQPSMVMQWNSSAPTGVAAQLYSREQMTAQMFNGKQVSGCFAQHQSPMCMGDSYPSILDQQVRMADVERVTSEMKRNRAQASRARRLAASQRRAKKYPLQKLIRMSSSAACIREKLDLGSTPGPLNLVSQNLTSSIIPTSQVQNFLPVALHGNGTLMSSSHEVTPYSNTIQGTLKYQYHHPGKAFSEDNHVSPSGSTTLQTQHHGHVVQPVSGLSTYGVTNIQDPSHSLDVVVLNQLQSIVSKMNVDARLCIRNALYRLASSAKHRQSRTENVPGLDENARQFEAMETDTNSIDRWIVNMLFCKQPALYEDDPQQNFTQSFSQSMDNTNMNGSTQQWNSCGSSVNLQ